MIHSASAAVQNEGNAYVLVDLTRFQTETIDKNVKRLPHGIAFSHKKSVVGGKKECRGQSIDCPAKNGVNNWNFWWQASGI